MVDGYCYYVTFSGKIRPVIDRVAAVAAGKSAAMQPDHHRTLVIAAESVGPDIQAQAILAHSSGGDGGSHFGNLGMRADLGSFRTPLHGVLDSGPGRGLGGGKKRRLPAVEAP